MVSHTDPLNRGKSLNNNSYYAQNNTLTNYTQNRGLLLKTPNTDHQPTPEIVLN